MVRHAEWGKIDSDKALWTVPAVKMKMRKAHVVLLLTQLLAASRELHQNGWGLNDVRLLLRTPVPGYVSFSRRHRRACRDQAILLEQCPKRQRDLRGRQCDIFANALRAARTGNNPRHRRMRQRELQRH